MPDCSVCGDTIYLGSRLREDAYVDDGTGGYKHVVCPRPPGFVSNYHKGKADGRCGSCGHKVPPDSLNKFYCSSTCMRDAREATKTGEFAPKDDDEY